VGLIYGGAEAAAKAAADRVCGLPLLVPLLRLLGQLANHDVKDSQRWTVQLGDEVNNLIPNLMSGKARSPPSVMGSVIDCRPQVNDGMSPVAPPTG
jgi:hypothetical protein